MNKLFSVFELNGITLSNRIIRASMFEPYCYKGVPTEHFIRMHERHIEGGVGMTTTGFVAVHPDGKFSPDQLDFTISTKDDLLPLADRIHALDGHIAASLSYMPCDGSCVHDSYLQTEDSLAEVVDAFVDAALLAAESGFDAIELHHFLTSVFIEENLNTRKDDYGTKSIESRSAYPKRILSSIREAVGPDFPILAKIAHNPSAISLGDYIGCCKELAPFLDAIVVFQMEGVMEAAFNMHELYCLDAARGLSQDEEISVPIVYSGGVDTKRDLELLMREEEDGGQVELVQIGRGLLRDYDMPNKIRDGRKFATCIKCNGCHGEVSGHFTLPSHLNAASRYNLQKEESRSSDHSKAPRRLVCIYNKEPF